MTRPRLLTERSVRDLIPPRRKDAHKGDFGHVLVIAGSRSMGGAAVLCGNAALRSGAGLVTVAFPGSLQTSVAARLRPEAMALPLPETAAGTVSLRSLPALRGYLEQRKITSVVIGPGLGDTPETYRFVRELLLKVRLPVVLDADGINVFARERGKLVASFSNAAAELILTPHPGELGRLAGKTVSEIQNDRSAAAAAFASKNRVICILKGYRTVVASPGAVFINPTGNPGMATGGSGDVLAGIIGALIAQAREPQCLSAACAGVYLHGLAGDCAAKEKTQAGMLAGDIIEMLPRALRKVTRHG